jgi:hydrophobic/amphiphilic exporter-1 (mainly G- bacteria), HAE1 family
MNLTRLFVHRPTLVFVIISLMSIAGVMAATTLVQQLFPNVAQPTVQILVTYNGASTTEMRDNIVAPIENNLAGSQNLMNINSSVQAGRATIAAVFSLNSSQAEDLVNVQKAVQVSQRQLPSNLTPPNITLNDPSESTVTTLALSSTKISAGQLSLLVDNVIGPLIQQIPGISFVTIQGDVVPAYEVLVNPNHLAAYGLTLNDVANAVTANNQRVPGGFAYEPNRETTIDVRGDIQTPQQIAGLSLTPATTSSSSSSTTAGVDYAPGITGLPGAVDPWTASNTVIRIGDIAKVIAGNEPRRVYAQMNGQNAVILNVQKTGDASEVTASDAVMKALPGLRQRFPDVTFKVTHTESIFTDQQIHGVINTLAEGIVLTGLVMIFFLRSWRNAVVVCVAIPTSLSIALFMMKIFGMTLDTISLLGMTLVIGILVDDSTVVLENIERHFHLGEKPEEAAVKGRSEIGPAAIVITMVDVVVFLPIAFVQGQVGRNLVEFSLVVVISTLASLFVSFTVTPTLSGLWALKSHWKPPGIIDAFGDQFDRLRDWYALRALPWVMARPRSMIALCLFSFVGSMALVPLGVVGEEFIPPTDRGQIFIQLQYPVGTPLQHVHDGADALEAVVDKLPDVQAATTVSGGYSASFGGFLIQGNEGQLVVFLNENRKYPTSYWVNRLKQLAPTIVKDAQITVVPATGQTGGNAQPIDELVTDVTGGDPTPYAQKVYQALLSTPGATNVNSSGSQLAPQIEVDFNRTKAQALNVDIGAAAIAAGAAFGGDQATQFVTPNGFWQVQIIYPLPFQHELSALGNIPIRSQNGSIVHMSDFATFKYMPTPPIVTRTNRLNVIHVDANVAASSSLSNVQAAFQQRVAALHLPSNIVVRPAPLGQQDLMNQTLVGLGGGLVLSVVLVFLLMVALYNSYRSPLIILFSVPVASVGALGALWMTHETLNLFSLIGTILLVGISAKNGILLVDYANTLRARGWEMRKAIMESAFTRFRPIMMTSIALIAGNLPLALALEPGSQTRASLGVVVIGGDASSLILTLVLVPIMYMIMAPKHVEVTERDEQPPELGGHGNGMPSRHALATN